MLYRNKKKNDINRGKWIGVGGKVEAGETDDQCMLREVKEETGLTVERWSFKGMIKFIYDQSLCEEMALFTADQVSGQLTKSCSEGVLKWTPRNQIMELSLWEGDRIFLKELLEGKEHINWTFVYQGDHLIDCWRSGD